MASLRDRMETFFAAAAFAESNDPSEAVRLLKEMEQRTRPSVRTDSKRDDRRPRLRAE